jgi:DNA invertase Pin-like site-specific DNA recombinase
LNTSFVDQEYKKIRQRQAEGITGAKSQGKYMGCPQVNLSILSKKQRQLVEENDSKWRKGDIKVVMFMEMLKLRKSTLYKIMKEYRRE